MCGQDLLYYSNHYLLSIHFPFNASLQFSSLYTEVLKYMKLVVMLGNSRNMLSESGQHRKQEAHFRSKAQEGRASAPSQ